MDERGDKNLDVDDFRWGLMDFGVQVTKEEANEILAHFDKDKNGSVNFNEFLVTLRVSKRIDSNYFRVISTTFVSA